jgi:hypothetical protein
MYTCKCSVQIVCHLVETAFVAAALIDLVCIKNLHIAAVNGTYAQLLELPGQLKPIPCAC